MDRIFINLKKKLPPGCILILSWGYIHVYDLYSQTSVLVHGTGTCIYISDLRTIGPQVHV